MSRGFLAADLIPAFHVWFGLTSFLLITTYLVNSISAQLRAKERAVFQSEQELKHAYREMEALNRLGQVVNSTLDQREVLGLKE